MFDQPLTPNTKSNLKIKCKAERDCGCNLPADKSVSMSTVVGEWWQTMAAMAHTTERERVRKRKREKHTKPIQSNWQIGCVHIKQIMLIIHNIFYYTDWIECNFISILHFLKLHLNSHFANVADKSRHWTGWGVGWNFAVCATCLKQTN